MISPTPGVCDCPVIVHTIVPGRLVGARRSRNHSAPRATIARHVGERLDVVDQRGRRFGLRVGRRPSRRGPTARCPSADRRRSRRPRRRRAGTAATMRGNGSGRRASRAARSPRRRGTRRGPRTPSSADAAEPTGGPDLVDRGAQARDLAGERTLQRRRRRCPASTAWAPMSAPSSTWYGLPRMIVRSLNVPGSPSAAFTTTVDRIGAREVLAHGPPLAPGREAGAAAAAEAGGFDHLDDRPRVDRPGELEARSRRRGARRTRRASGSASGGAPGGSSVMTGVCPRNQHG